MLELLFQIVDVVVVVVDVNLGHAGHHHCWFDVAVITGVVITTAVVAILFVVIVVLLPSLLLS